MANPDYKVRCCHPKQYKKKDCKQRKLNHRQEKETINKIAEDEQFPGERLKLVNLIRSYRTQGKGLLDATSRKMTVTIE